MKAELLGVASAEERQCVAALDQRDAVGDLALEFGRADFAAVLLALLLALRLLVAIEIAFDPLAGTVKDIDDVPEQVFKIRLDARVDNCHNQHARDEQTTHFGRGYYRDTNRYPLNNLGEIPCGV